MEWPLTLPIDFVEIVIAEVSPFVIRSGGAVNGEGGLPLIKKHLHQHIVGV